MEEDLAIPTPRREKCTIRGEGESPYLIAMVTQGEKRSTRAGIPDPDGVVVAGRRDTRSIRGEARHKDLVKVPLEV
jgi:hypothetical protein